MIRVGFVLAFVDQIWIGGLNYYKSLLSAIYELPGRQIEPVMFIGTKTPLSLLRDFPPVERIQTSLLDRWHPRWVQRILMYRITGKERLLEKELINHGISVLSHFGALGEGSPVKTIGWIQDFQHKRLPDFFSEGDRRQRDTHFRRTCELCDVVLLSSYAAQSDLSNFMPSCIHKSRVLQFSPDISNVKQTSPIEEVRKKYDIEGDYFHLPNQFWRHKNHGVVVEALKLLGKNGSDITVVCTGNTFDYRHPGYFNKLMDLVEKYGLSRKFIVLGVVPHADLIALMKNALALINPSLFEGWSTTVEEAKVLGKTILLSDIDVHIEQNPSGGLYFGAHDSVALASLIERVIHSGTRDAPQAEDEVLNARRKFAENYQKIVLGMVS
jgi:glycosyltransferase involved in cell wall biosynthesis